MYIPTIHRRLYLDIFEVIWRRSASQRRCVSTVSAINRGLRATRDNASGHWDSPKRRVRRDGVGEGREKAADDATNLTGSHPEQWSLRKGRTSIPESAYRPQVDALVDAPVRRIADLVTRIQKIEAAGGTSPPKDLVEKARQGLNDLNYEIRKKLVKRGSVEMMVRSARECLDVKPVQELQGMTRFEDMVVSEDDEHMFRLVVKGDTPLRPPPSLLHQRNLGLETRSDTTEREAEAPKIGGKDIDTIVMKGKDAATASKAATTKSEASQEATVGTEAPKAAVTRVEASKTSQEHTGATKHVEVSVDPSLFRPLKDISRVHALFQIIRDEERYTDRNTIPSTMEYTAAVEEVRTLVAGLNNMEPSWTGQDSIDQFMLRRLRKHESYVPYVNVAKKMMGEKTLITRNGQGRLMLVMKGERDAARMIQPNNRRPGQLSLTREAVPQTRGIGKLSVGTPLLWSDDDRNAFSSPRNRAVANQLTPSTQSEDEVDGPLSIPYTTAASQFLYGSNVVLAALRAKRRKLYHLHVSQRAFARQDNAATILSLAHDASIPVDRNTHVMLLDKMSEDRPHNGVVLEASRLPAPPVLALGKPDTRSRFIPVTLDRQSWEDAAVNGKPQDIPTAASTWRQPFVVMLDGITDPGNLGNILRTAHFYGVDAVAIASNTCADLSLATVAKASSGACEAVRLLALPKPSDFVFNSARAGWRVYAAVAPDTTGKFIRNSSRSVTTSEISAASPLLRYPSLLMLGSEGEGLRQNLVTKADYLLSIDRGDRESQMVDVGVDSLNVSVAAGVLMEAFLRKPVGTQRQ